MPTFYESESNTEAPERTKRTPRVKETPFKVTKTSRQSRSKSRSPMVTSTNKKATSAGRAHRGRLRHEDSQLQFEPIQSSPSRPNNQESQVLTERQLEVLERQGRSSNLYGGMRSTSPLPTPIALARSPLEFHSDALGEEQTHLEPSRTPLRSVRSLGPMDVFVGSSPTPRPRSQEVINDRNSVTTPTAVRTIQLSHEADDFGSSPPRFERDASTRLRTSQIADDTNYSDQNNPENEELGGDTSSFDDGITLEEGGFLTGTPDEDPEANLAVKSEASEMLSSTLDLQLTAQLDAEIQSRKDAAISKTPRRSPRQNNVEAKAENGTKGDGTEVDLMTIAEEQSNAETNSTSCVDDSFTSQVADGESFQTRSLRRSHRNAVSSPQAVSAKKRRHSSGRGPGRPKKTKAGQTLDEVVMTTPRADALAMKQSATPSRMSGNDTVIVPDTTRTQGIRRSASALSQVETHSEEVVLEDTPAPKRSRRNIDKDVSEAKHNTPSSSQQLRSQRLRHVQATPKHHDGRDAAATAEGDSVQPSTDGPRTGEQSVTVARQLPDATADARLGRESHTQIASNSVATPRRSRSIAERVFLTPRSIIDKLKELKEALFGAPQLALNRQEHREADELFFEIRMAVHDAGRRGEQADQ